MNKIILALIIILGIFLAFLDREDYWKEYSHQEYVRGYFQGIDEGRNQVLREQDDGAHYIENCQTGSCLWPNQ